MSVVEDAPPDDGQLAVTEITPVHPLYERARRLRYLVLRLPLGMPEGSEENAREAECRHWVATLGDDVVGCVLWVREPREHWRGAEASEQHDLGRLLQMAVTPELQGTGLGRRLVTTLEEAVGAAGFRIVTLHARDLAVGFYLRLGYEVVGLPFTEVGIDHRHMRKVLPK